MDWLRAMRWEAAGVRAGFAAPGDHHAGGAGDDAGDTAAELAVTSMGLEGEAASIREPIAAWGRKIGLVGCGPAPLPCGWMTASEYARRIFRRLRPERRQPRGPPGRDQEKKPSGVWLLCGSETMQVGSFESRNAT